MSSEVSPRQHYPDEYLQSLTFRVLSNKVERIPVPGPPKMVAVSAISPNPQNGAQTVFLNALWASGNFCCRVFHDVPYDEP